ncbi:MAG: RNA polymerase sigma-54 factor, partial [Bacteroidales bacterium]|nr:RNA polymerase sigma-54 factor [Bacteroidales bacterium]
VNSKYVRTPYGTYLLKDFFSESMTTDSGEEVSNKKIKSDLKEIIDNEDKTNPLTDDDLVKTLNEKGYNIARRTIAKYRVQLGIPSARMRKRI